MRKAAIIMMLALALAIIGGCKEERKVDRSSLSPRTMPTMATKNVSTLISDSGRIQYKIVAPEWMVYDEADTPYWIFPQGIYLQKYDKAFNVIATVAADSARYYKNQKLWRLDGNVEMTKLPKDLFLSERLFWDQRQRIIYSDTFMHIETEKHTLEGIGFESNENLTVYKVLKPQGIFPVNKDNLKNDDTSPQGPQPMPETSLNPADHIQAQ